MIKLVDKDGAIVERSIKLLKKEDHSLSAEEKEAIKAAYLKAIESIKE
ncbi:MAG TPA: hypothetical protein VJC07_03445 [Candidatus Nanoarchaeia archaeon]|nr:hypothetical protein [Candidatus Nanoarchaeia archaeon]